MGVMEYADGKMKIRKDYEINEKSHFVDEMEDLMKKKRKGDV